MGVKSRVKSLRKEWVLLGAKSRSHFWKSFVVKLEGFAVKASKLEATKVVSL